MSDSSVQPALPLRSEFPRKVTLLFLLITDTAVGIFFLFKFRPETHLLVRLIFADLVIGIVAGFAARILFRRRAWFIRFISAAAAVIIGLLILGVLTRFRLGFGPLYFWRNTIDWSGLAHITLGLNCMLLAMQAWSKPRQARTNQSSATPGTATPAPAQVHSRTRPKRKRTKSALSSGTPSNNETTRTEHRAKPIITRKRNAKTESKSVPNLFHRKPQVRLSLVEKHLCPYCLEPVVQKDPRGIVECDICHTLHHGDCWAIAGYCQVPHYTA
ncbi:MAG: hypothetical protein NTW32_07160 [Chloroflexi bacterium]|nr:hypothetical protein [Chloroflexota bacterium]